MILTGKFILVCVEQPLVAMDITDELNAAGAHVSLARSETVGLELATGGALVDACFVGAEASALSLLLEARRIPFLIYSGAVPMDQSDRQTVSKPALPGTITRRLAAICGS